MGEEEFLIPTASLEELLVSSQKTVTVEGNTMGAGCAKTLEEGCGG